MSNNLTLGAIQVLGNDVASINLAFAQVLEQLDHLRGLRGRAEVWDRVRVSAPTVGTDAVNQDALTAQESRFRLVLYGGPGLVVKAPGTSYAEVSTLLRQPVDLTDLTSPQARLLVWGFGTESGNTKGVCLHTGSAVVAEVTWNGASEGLQTGTFTAVTLTTDGQLQLRTKGSSATEDLVLYRVEVEWKASIQVLA